MAVKQPPQLNGTQTADMAFILVCFFMMVTTMGSEYGLIRMLPPWVGETLQGDKINERNVFVVNVNMHNVVGVRGEPTPIQDLRRLTKEFFSLTNTGDNFPVKVQKDLPLVGTMIVNEVAVVSLQNDRGTSYRTYMQVQNELTAAINELRDEFCMQRFGRLYEECTQEQQDVVGKDIFPMSISEAEPRDVSNTR